MSFTDLDALELMLQRHHKLTTLLDELAADIELTIFDIACEDLPYSEIEDLANALTTKRSTRKLARRRIREAVGLRVNEIIGE